MKIFRANWFPFSLGMIIIFVIAKDMLREGSNKVANIVSLPAEKELKVDWWISPPLWEIPAGQEGDLVKYGRSLIANTATYFGPKGIIKAAGNGMNCQNCHLDAGTKPWGNNYGGVYSTYPLFRQRSGSLETIPKRINDCLQRSLNSQPIDSNSREMKAIIAYMKWIGRDVKKGEKPKGAGISDLPFLDRAANPVRGEKVYTQTCARCHGADGQGVADPFGVSYIYPPLWGPHSYTTAAGLYRLSRFAGYVRDNMPFGASHHSTQVSDEDAWDVAAFVNSQPRPEKVFPEDWPNIAGKPIDHPFGPYADSFSEAQHKYGPFGPIKKFKDEQQKNKSARR